MTSTTGEGMSNALEEPSLRDVMLEILLAVSRRRPLGPHRAHVRPECVARFQRRGRSARPVSVGPVRLFRAPAGLEVTIQERAKVRPIHGANLTTDARWSVLFAR